MELSQFEMQHYTSNISIPVVPFHLKKSFLYNSHLKYTSKNI